MPTRPTHIEAEITYVPTAQGGKKIAVYSGYCGQFFYDGEDWDAIQTYPEVERVNPGDTVVARLSFLSPQYHRGKVYPGMAFEVREGAQVVGRGVVTKVFEF